MSETSRHRRWSALLASLCETDYQIAIAVTGGGTGSLTLCFARPGASRNFVDAAIPYSRASAVAYLGEPLGGPSASVEVAGQIARQACQRADRLSDRSVVNPVGIGLVAALPTEPPAPAEHRIHAAMFAADKLTTWSVRLPDQGMSRSTAELAADELVFRAIADLIGFESNEAFFRAAGLSVETDANDGRT